MPRSSVPSSGGATAADNNKQSGSGAYLDKPPSRGAVAPPSGAATTVMVMFESQAALDAADEIAAIGGLDMVMIGTNDLLAELGLPAGEFDHPAIKDAYARTIDACAKYGKHVGVGGLASRPDLVAEFVKMGARYVSTGTDLTFLAAAAREKAAEVAKLEV